MVIQSGRRVAGARRLVSYPAQSDRQRGRHYVGSDAGRGRFVPRFFGGVTGSGADLFVAGYCPMGPKPGWSQSRLPSPRRFVGVDKITAAIIV